MMPFRTFTAALVVLAGARAAAAAGVRDTAPRPEPPLALPAAGGAYVDPVFGSRIVRVTDAAIGTHCTHAYSYWPAFNADGTRLLLACDDAPLVFRFDPTTGTSAPEGPLGAPTDPPVQFEGASWSHEAPHVLFALDRRGRRLWEIDLARPAPARFRLLRDFTGDVASDVFLAQLTVSDDARTFSFHARRRADGRPLEALVWDRAEDRVHRHADAAARAPLNETQVDHAGRLVLVSRDDDTVTFWDPRSGAETTLSPDDASAVTGGHYDLGRAIAVNSDTFETGLVVRSLRALGAPRNILRYTLPDGTANWSIADHASLVGDAECLVVGSTYGGGEGGAFEREIYLAWPDGGGFVRLAHTRSAGASASPGWRYFSQPRAVADRAGRWIAFTSDLGSADRLDVLVLEIPAELRPVPTASRSGAVPPAAAWRCPRP